VIPPAGGTVAVAAHAAERRVIERLQQLGATSPDTAQTLPGLSPLESRRLARLVRRRVAVEISPGIYYLDPQALREYQAARGPLRLIAFALLVGALVVLGLLLFTHAF
jgi:hypothetical protein